MSYVLRNFAVGISRGMNCGSRRSVMPLKELSSRFDISSDTVDTSRRFFSKKTNLPDDQDEPYTFEDLMDGDQPWFADDVDLEHLLSNNRRWRDAKLEKDGEYFNKLGRGQRPKFLYIGCSDSRIPANEIMGIGPGSVFVHRNVANLVVNTDMNLMSCLQYAVDALEVHHILVTGHYDCGGVKAAVTKHNHGGVLQHWIRNIRDVYRLHRDELDAIQDEEARHRRLVELNVVEQCLNLYKTGIVQKKRRDTWLDDSHKYAFPRIHGMVFDPCEGVLKKLPLNFKEQINELGDVYDLYDIEEEKSHYMLKKPLADK